MRARLRSSVFVSLLAGIISLCGCAYTVGPVNGVIAKEKSVQIVPFANQTLEPHLTDEVTSQLRKTLQQDATYRLATHGDGDIVVTGTIIGYDRLELNFAAADALTVRDFRIGLRARVTATDRGSGKVLFQKPVGGFTMIRVGADLTSSERQALPLLAADLAKNITSLLVEGTW